VCHTSFGIQPHNQSCFKVRATSSYNREHSLLFGLPSRTSQFKVQPVDLRKRHLEHWEPYSDTHPHKHNSKRTTYHPYKEGPGRIFTIHPSQIHYDVSWPSLLWWRYPPDSGAAWLAPSYVPTPYKLKFREWPDLTIPPILVTCGMLMTNKMGSIIMSFSTAPRVWMGHPHVVSLRRTDASLFPPTGFHNVSAFLSQNSNRAIFLPSCVNCFLWAG